MPDASSWRTNRQLRETEDWKQQARAALKLTPSLSHPHSCLSMMTGFENPRETWNPLMGSRPGCSDSLPESPTSESRSDSDTRSASVRPGKWTRRAVLCRLSCWDCLGWEEVLVQ